MASSGAAADLILARLEDWRGRLCPFCGHPPDPWYLGIFSSVSFSCTACDRVIEGFEVYEDDHGHAYMENHLLPTPADPPTP